MKNNIGLLGGLRVEAMVKSQLLSEAIRKYYRKQLWIFNRSTAQATVADRGIDSRVFARTKV